MLMCVSMLQERELLNAALVIRCLQKKKKKKIVCINLHRASHKHTVKRRYDQISYLNQGKRFK